MERPSVVSEREAPAKGLVAQVVTMLNGQAQSESAERSKLLSECAHARGGPEAPSRQPAALHGINKRS
ncbi:hypothetical protein RR48_12485 [Papilio machaon]|uniref:Uncharacterized protein n=1 Tax=Papilio machaon TaxID=76193 RepID=A0A194RNI1_PAPMA|nr:hypothetical protein RR48_12485 [Papilio machaon]